jgi:hypothetical protein
MPRKQPRLSVKMISVLSIHMFADNYFVTMPRTLNEGLIQRMLPQQSIIFMCVLIMRRNHDHGPLFCSLRLILVRMYWREGTHIRSDRMFSRRIDKVPLLVEAGNVNGCGEISDSGLN